MDQNKNYKKLYFKYKLKYLNLKKNLDGGTSFTNTFPSATEGSDSNFFSILGIERPILTIENSGNPGVGGYSQQCMYISIHNFLTRNGYSNLTFLDFRRSLGIEDEYKRNQEWDEYDEDDTAAIQNAAEIYNLDIRIWQRDISVTDDSVDLRFYRDGEEYKRRPQNIRLLNPVYRNNQGTGIAPRSRYQPYDGNGIPVNIAAGYTHFDLIIGGSIFGEPNEQYRDEKETESVNVLKNPKTGEYVSMEDVDEDFKRVLLIENEIIKLDSQHEREKFAKEQEIITKHGENDEAIERETMKLHGELKEKYDREKEKLYTKKENVSRESLSRASSISFDISDFLSPEEIEQQKQAEEQFKIEADIRKSKIQEQQQRAVQKQMEEQRRAEQRRAGQRLQVQQRETTQQKVDISSLKNFTDTRKPIEKIIKILEDNPDIRIKNTFMTWLKLPINQGALDDKNEIQIINQFNYDTNFKFDEEVKQLKRMVKK
tara:strand:+ start:392 stop:1846 length:1455 start_codon:yes stop_codon:yes gene_type:complete